MKGSAVIFYLLALLSLVSGFLAVTTKKIFRAAIFLLFSLVGIAGIYFWLQYEFVAAVQIVVYVGGIVVLIIFSIFLTQQSGEDLPLPAMGRRLFAGLAALLGFIIVWLQIASYDFPRTKEQAIVPGIAEIGKQMMGIRANGYALPFEVISMLLLAAMIACIAIAMRTQKQENTV